METTLDAPVPQSGGDLIKDSDSQNFETDVIAASMEIPVIVDFWAPWCGPCKQLGPAIEKAVTAAGGKVRLVKIDIDGTIVGPSEHPVNPAGFVIHSAVHAAREDAHCIMHTHTRAGMAVAAMECGLQGNDFAGIALHDRVAYHDFEGVTVRNDERERLAEDLGDKNLMILRNHGLLSCGRTIPQAFLRLYTLETACQVQTTAQAANTPLITPSPDARERHAEALENADSGELAFDALVRLMDRRDPSFRD